MDIKELRVKNLTAFVKAYGGAASLVNAHPELSAAYLWQLINFHRPFGEKSARKIETICKLQPNFFDRISHDYDLNERMSAHNVVMQALPDEARTEVMRQAIKMAELISNAKADKSDPQK